MFLNFLRILMKEMQEFIQKNVEEMVRVSKCTSLDHQPPKPHPSYSVLTQSDFSWLLPVSGSHSIQSSKAVLFPYCVQSISEQFLLMSEAVDAVAPNLKPKYDHKRWRVIEGVFPAETKIGFFSFDTNIQVQNQRHTHQQLEENWQ